MTDRGVTHLRRLKGLRQLDLQGYNKTTEGTEGVLINLLVNIPRLRRLVVGRNQLKQHRGVISKGWGSSRGRQPGHGSSRSSSGGDDESD